MAEISQKTRKILLFGMIVLAVALVAIVLILVLGQGGGGSAVISGNGVQEALCLDSGWKITADSEGTGFVNKWYKDDKFPDYSAVDTVVPGETTEYVSSASVVWYQNSFDASNLKISKGQRLYVQLDGVNYKCTAWLNGEKLGEHEGIYSSVSFDITDTVKLSDKNNLVICVSVPRTEQKTYASQWGMPYMQQPVYIYVKPEVTVSDIYAKTDYETGKIEIEVTVNNPTDQTKTVNLEANVAFDMENLLINKTSGTVSAPAGTSVHTLTLQVDNRKTWSPDEPNLYRVNVRMQEKGSSFYDEKIEKVGFKLLRVDDYGYFELNGERIYLSSTHLGSYRAESFDTAAGIDKIYQELMYLKSCGFNTVRIMMNAALPQQLEICDEIGLMVYEECAASWKIIDSDITYDQLTDTACNIIRRDRNHASFAIYGMLNETLDSGTSVESVRAALDALPSVKEADPNLLYLFSSGRWDGRLGVASASNPGSDAWDAWMGDEGEGKEQITGITGGLPGYVAGMGDVHYYPYMPYNSSVRDFIRKIGFGTNAVFLSEAGAGSEFNVVSDYLKYEQYYNGSTRWEYQYLPSMYSEMNTIFENYGYDKLYADTEDLLLASQEMQSKQRALLFDYIRSNSQLSGYSLTMSTDGGFVGEGIMSVFCDYKVDMTETLQEGWADTRWCVMLDKTHFYSDEAVHLMVTLATENSLEEGKEYNVTVRISGSEGTVYKKDLTFTPEVGDDGYIPFAINLFDENLSLDLKEGDYRISVAFTSGAHAEAGYKEFSVTEKSKMADLSGSVEVLGASKDLTNLLTSHGATVTEFNADSSVGTVLVGNGTLTNAQWRALYKKAALGGHIIFLDPTTLVNGSSLHLPFTDGTGSYYVGGDWLYHKESVVFETAVTEGVGESGILDPEVFASTYTSNYFTDLPVPDVVHISSFMCGWPWSTDGMRDGFQIGTYKYHNGYITLNALALRTNVGDATADKLIVNMVSYALKTAKSPSGTLPASFNSEILAAVK